MTPLSFGKYHVSEKIFIVLTYAFLVLFAILCIFPFFNVLAKSFSPEYYIMQGQVWLWPVKISLNGYEKILQAIGIVLGFRNSLVVSVVGTTVNLLMSSLIAYPLSRKRLPLPAQLRQHRRFHDAVSHRVDPYVSPREVPRAHQLHVVIDPSLCDHDFQHDNNEELLSDHP